ncbi:MAG: formyltransferase family protein [Candidatus Kerfeldbacteria bacterium]|jgi:folate-dependent phosphoribosylglycinamide formyltransferase PurN
MEIKNNNKKIKVALLTGGSGPILNKMYQYLLINTDLKALVISNKVKKKSFFIHTFREYGLWYIWQMTIKKVFYIIFNWCISQKKIKNKGIKLLKWSYKKDEIDIINQLKESGIELVITCGFGKIVSNDFINSFNFCINIHPSFLPSYRGPEPIIWGLLFKDKKFGITAHLLDEQIDNGNIISQSEIKGPILPLHISVEINLSKKIEVISEEIIKFVSDSKQNSTKQSKSQYFPLPNKENRTKIFIDNKF